MEDRDGSGSQEIKDTDIIFECPHCEKSLAIDYHAAGLSIPCTDCGKFVVVPIPDGMEVSDLDKSVEDQGALIIHLREAVANFQARTSQLEAMVEDCTKQRQSDALKEAENTRRFEQLSHDVETVSKAVDEINAALASMAKTIRDYSRPAQ